MREIDQELWRAALEGGQGDGFSKEYHREHDNPFDLQGATSNQLNEEMSCRPNL